MILKTIGSVDLIVGETRKIFIEVINDSTENFRIEDGSTWEFKKEHSDKIESNGECTKSRDDEHVLIAVVSPKEKGIYHLIYCYKVAGETIKSRVEVRVS